MPNSALTILSNVRSAFSSTAIVFALSFLFATAALAETTEGNTNRAGNDLRQGFEIVPRTNSIAGDGVADRCREACEKETACLAWTAVKPGIQSKNGVCWLKRSVGVAAKDTCCTSGTSSRYKPIKRTGKSTVPPPGGGATKNVGANFANKILEYSRSKLGSRIGGGECSHFVEGALAYAGAAPGTFPKDGDYVWGRKINFPAEPALPGDIIQLVNARLVYTSATRSQAWDTSTQHTAIVESVAGKVLKVFEQNIPVGGGVARAQYDLNWKLERGFYKIYRPI